MAGPADPVGSSGRGWRRGAGPSPRSIRGRLSPLGRKNTAAKGSLGDVKDSRDQSGLSAGEAPNSEVGERIGGPRAPLRVRLLFCVMEAAAERSRRG